MTKMFWCDLNVMSDLGFPQTASRIREELMSVRNADNYLMWAFENGYGIEKNRDSEWLTDEANFNFKWSVKRSEPPYCAIDNERYWSGPTVKEALSNAILSMAKWNDNIAERRKAGVKKMPVPEWVLKDHA